MRNWSLVFSLLILPAGPLELEMAPLEKSVREAGATRSAGPAPVARALRAPAPAQATRPPAARYTATSRRACAACRGRALLLSRSGAAKSGLSKGRSPASPRCSPSP